MALYFPTKRIYERYIGEDNKTVTVCLGNKNKVLQRSRMYNSRIDIHGMLYTEYADKEYHPDKAKR